MDSYTRADAKPSGVVHLWQVRCKLPAETTGTSRRASLRSASLVLPNLPGYDVSQCDAVDKTVPLYQCAAPQHVAHFACAWAPL